jgi:hypothetical protein
MDKRVSQVDSPACQLKGFGRISDPVGRVETVWQFRNRLRHTIKRRLRYVRNWLDEVTGAQGTASNPPARAKAGSLQAGDTVRVRSKEEIKATLDRWNRLRGCDFMEEMWPYCGTTQRVYKRVGRFLDERDYRMKRCRGIVFLDGLICEGTVDYGPCDRSCFYFWREEWLEKVE